VAGFTAYGRKGLPSERVAESACHDLMAHHHRDAAADLHLADQLVLPAAFAAGVSHWTTCRVSRHLTTNAWVVRQFLQVPINITGGEGEPGTVSVG
jgi:RNA 3'-terminal phosphate cyclase (ATP)